MRLLAGARGVRVLLATAIVAAGLAAGSAATDPASAQTTPSTGAPVVMVRSPNYSAGNTTVTGIAVDCSTGAPATRVAIYDGPDTSYPYVADVSMDTVAPFGAACPGRAGSARIGFTLIYNSRFLSEGTHQLLFNAEFPDGTSAGSIVPIYIENRPPYVPSCRDEDCRHD